MLLLKNITDVMVSKKERNIRQFYTCARHIQNKLKWKFSQYSIKVSLVYWRIDLEIRLLVCQMISEVFVPVWRAYCKADRCSLESLFHALNCALVLSEYRKYLSVGKKVVWAMTQKICRIFGQGCQVICRPVFILILTWEKNELALLIAQLLYSSLQGTGCST